MKLYGGAAIGSGSFGCAFHPSLQTDKQNKSVDFVSKLMTTRHAEKESERLIRLVEVVQTLPPDVQQLFLVPDPTVLHVVRFEDADLANLESKCNRFFKDKPHLIEPLKRNDPTTLEKFRVINSQYGGNAVKDIIDATEVNARMYTELIENYIAFLEKGVGALVANNVLHGDIKVENMLWDPKQKRVRLIDWGSFDEERTQWWYNFPIQVLFNVKNDTTTLETILANLVDVTRTNKQELMEATAAVFLGQSLTQDKNKETLPYFSFIIHKLLQVCSVEARKSFKDSAKQFWDALQKRRTIFLNLFQETFRPYVEEGLNKLISLKEENRNTNAPALFLLCRSLMLSFNEVMTVENNRLVFNAQKAKAEVKKYFDTYSTLLALAQVVSTPMKNMRGLSPLQGGQSGDEGEERKAKRARIEAPVYTGDYVIPDPSVQWRVVGAGSTFYDAVVSLGSATSVDDLGEQMAKTWGKQKEEERYKLFEKSSTETQQMLLLYGDSPATWTTGDPQNVHMQVLAKALGVRIAVLQKQDLTGDFTAPELVTQLVSGHSGQVQSSGTKGQWLYLAQHDKQFWGLSPHGDKWSKQGQVKVVSAAAAAAAAVLLMAPSPSEGVLPPAQQPASVLAPVVPAPVVPAPVAPAPVAPVVPAPVAPVASAPVEPAPAPAPVAPAQQPAQRSQERTFEYHYATGDGGCLYYAVEIALQRTPQAYKRYGSFDQSDTSYRKQLVQEYGKLLELGYRSMSLEQQREISQLIYDDSIDLSEKTSSTGRAEATDLLHNLTESTAWAKGYAHGYHVLVLSYALKVPIAVYGLRDGVDLQLTTTIKRLWEEKKTLRQTDVFQYDVYNLNWGEPQIYVLYNNGTLHYDALIPQGAQKEEIQFLRTLRQRRTAELSKALAAPAQAAAAAPARAPPPSPAQAPPPASVLAPVVPAPVVPAPVVPAPALTRDQMTKVQQALADKLLTLLQESAFTKTPEEAATDLRNTFKSALATQEASEKQEPPLSPQEQEPSSKRRRIDKEPEAAKEEPFKVQPGAEAATAPDIAFTQPSQQPQQRPDYMRVWSSDKTEADNARSRTRDQEQEVCGTLWYPLAEDRLRYKDFQCLQPEQWLTGRIINAYLLLIKAAAPQNCVMFSTDVFSQQKLDRVHSDNVVNYTVDKQLIVSDTSIIIIPINMEGSRTTAKAWKEGGDPTVGLHWYFMYVKVSEKTLVICDSIKWDDPDKYKPDVAVVKRILATFLPRELMPQKPVVETMFPRQENGYDCGVFMSMGIECVTQSRPFDFSLSSNDLRTLMAAQINRGNLKRIECSKEDQLKRRKDTETVVVSPEGPAAAEQAAAERAAAERAAAERAAAEQAAAERAAAEQAAAAEAAAAEAALVAAPEEQAVPWEILWGEGEWKDSDIYNWFTDQPDVTVPEQEQLATLPPVPILAPVPSYMTSDAWRATLRQVNKAVHDTKRQNEHVEWVDKTFHYKIELTLQMLYDVFIPKQTVPENAILLYMYLLQQRSQWRLEQDMRASNSVILNTFDTRLDFQYHIPLKTCWIQNLEKDEAVQEEIPSDTTVFVALRLYTPDGSGPNATYTRDRPYHHPYALVFDRTNPADKIVYVLDARPRFELNFYGPQVEQLTKFDPLGDWIVEGRITIEIVPLTTDWKEDVPEEDAAVYMCMAVERFTRTRLQRDIKVLNLDKAGTQRRDAFTEMRYIMAAQLYVGELDSWERRKERIKQRVEKQDAAKLWVAVQKLENQINDTTAQTRDIKKVEAAVEEEKEQVEAEFEEEKEQVEAEVEEEMKKRKGYTYTLEEVKDERTRLETKVVPQEDRCMRLRCAALEYARREYCKYDDKIGEAQKAIYTAQSKHNLAAKVKPKLLCLPREDYFNDKKEEWENQQVVLAAAAAAEEGGAAAAAAEEEGAFSPFYLPPGSPYVEKGGGGGLTEEKKEIVAQQKREKAYYTILRDDIEKHVTTYNQVLKEQGCVVDTKTEAEERKPSRKRRAEGEGEEKNEPKESVEQTKITYKQEIPKHYYSWVGPLATCAQYAQQTQGKGKVPTQRRLEELNDKLNRLVKSKQKHEYTLMYQKEVKDMFNAALNEKRKNMDAVKFVDNVRKEIQHLHLKDLETVTDRLTATAPRGTLFVTVNDATKFRVDNKVQIGKEIRRVASINGNTLILKTKPFRKDHPVDETIEVIVTIVDVLPGFTTLLKDLTREQRSELLTQWEQTIVNLLKREQLSTKQKLLLENLSNIKQVLADLDQEPSAPVQESMMAAV